MTTPVRSSFPARLVALGLAALAGTSFVAYRAWENSHMTDRADPIADPYQRIMVDGERAALPDDTELDRARGPQGNSTTIMVVGESLGTNLAHGLARGLDRDSRMFDRTQLGCPLWSGEVKIAGKFESPDRMCKAPWGTRYRSYVDDIRPDIVVAMFGPPGTATRRLEDRVVPAGTEDPSDAKALTGALDILQRHGAKIVLVTTPPTDPPREVIAQYAQVGYVVPDAALRNSWNRHLTAASATRDGVEVIDSATPLGEVGTPGVRLRSTDGIHLTPEGADLLAQAVLPAVRAEEGPDG